MAVSPSRRQFVSPAVSKWQSLSAEDSLLTFTANGSTNGSLFQQKTVCFPSSQQMAVSFSRRQFAHFLTTGSTNGSLFQQKTVCFPSSQQMTVSFSRRQFAHFLTTGSTNGSLFQQK